MYSNVTGPQAPRTSGPHQRPTHPAYAAPRVTGPQQVSGPHRVTGPQQAVPTRGTGPHQAPPRRPAPPAKRAGSTGPKLVAAAVALAVMGGVGGWLAYDAPAGNQYQTVSYAGDNPFTSPVGTDRPDVKPVAAGGERPGETPEMYTGDPAKPACDAASLVEQLQADPAKAAAWADIQRITPSALPRFVDGLTPVVLRANTAVVDHGYVDGAFRSTPAVLAPGTAVFINSYGQPTVKCYSGNPLTPGTTDDPAVTTVTAAAAPITTNVFNNVTTNAPISFPGKPDTTGTGPSTGGDDEGGGKGGGGTTTPPEKLTGTFEYNGAIALSNGKFQLPSGAIVTPPPMPEGATALEGGGWKDKDGKIFSPLGVERVKSQLAGTNPPQFITPEGKLVDKQGIEIPLGKDQFILKNFDGTTTLVTNKNGTVVTEQFDARGKSTSKEEFDGTYDPESKAIKKGGVIIQNVDHSTRKETKIPGGTVGIDNKTTPTLLAENGEKVANPDQKVGTDKELTKVEKNDPTTLDPTLGGTIDPATGQKTDPATGKPVEGAPVEGAPIDKAPAAGTNTGVDPVDPPVVESGPVTKVPGNTGVIVPPVDETAGSTTGTSSGTSTGTSSGTSTGTSSGTSTGTASGTTSGSGSGESASTGGGEGGNG